MSNNQQANKPAQAEAPKTPKVEGEVYTYIGGGTDSPQLTTLKGVDGFEQKFVRGKATPVSDKEILRKIVKNPTFKKGAVEQEVLFEMDEKAARHDASIRDRALRMDTRFKKKHGGGKDEE